MERSKLPTYIPLEEAVQQYGIPRALLAFAIETDIIRAVNTPEGIMVAETDVKKLARKLRNKQGEITADTTSIAKALEEDEDAEEELVSIFKASQRLGVTHSTVLNWYRKGWLPAFERGPRNAILVSFRRAQALARLRKKLGQRGRRLIPRGVAVEDFLAANDIAP